MHLLTWTSNIFTILLTVFCAFLLFDWYSFYFKGSRFPRCKKRQARLVRRGPCECSPCGCSTVLVICTIVCLFQRLSTSSIFTILLAVFCTLLLLDWHFAFYLKGSRFPRGKYCPARLERRGPCECSRCGCSRVLVICTIVNVQDFYHPFSGFPSPLFTSFFFPLPF